MCQHEAINDAVLGHMPISIPEHDMQVDKDNIIIMHANRHNYYCMCSSGWLCYTALVGEHTWS